MLRSIVPVSAPQAIELATGAVITGNALIVKITESFTKQVVTGSVTVTSYSNVGGPAVEVFTACVRLVPPGMATPLRVHA